MHGSLATLTDTPILSRTCMIIDTHARSHTYTRTHAHTHTYSLTTHTRAFFHTHACSHTHIHMHTHSHTHVHTCAHVCTHIHTLTQKMDKIRKLPYKGPCTPGEARSPGCDDVELSQARPNYKLHAPLPCWGGGGGEGGVPAKILYRTTAIT